MASPEDQDLHWSAQLTTTPPTITPKLPGDKIILPQSALEQLLAAAPIREVSPQGPGSGSRSYTRSFDPFNPHTFAAESRAREAGLQRQQQLPHPLTFRIVNPRNERVVYAGIREFSGREGEVGLSAFLRGTLGIDDEEFDLQVYTGEIVNGENGEMNGEAKTQTQGPLVTVHAKQLPKGTYVRLRPLEAGYDPEDWKALLERYLRENFTTLTTGEVLTVQGGHDEFRFLVDKVFPEGDGICVVDTDLEVDILALSEEQARETLKKRLEKASRAPGTKEGSSIGGVVAVGETVTAQVVPGEYVDYELQNWNRDDVIEVQMDAEDEADVSLFVNPLSSRQRSRPREDEHVFGDLSSRLSKRIRIQSTNIELEGAESLYISAHAGETGEGTPMQYNLRIVANPKDTQEDSQEDSHDPEDVQCNNCQQWVPNRTLVLHENFCLRNNAFCSQCGSVFQKRSEEWQNHWHCPHDSSYGNNASSKQRHDARFHGTFSCPNCEFQTEGISRLAQHRTTTCPGKLILCQFCHLVVPQQGDSDPDILDPEVLLSGLTPHELVDGGRTTECHLCNKIIRLRDMKTHLRHHDLERLSRPTPRICLNQNCGRTLAPNTTDSLGLCSICFGPLYVDTYDPDGKALRRRIERRYLSQLMAGCNKPWCQNPYCKTGKAQSTQPNQPTQPTNAASILTTVRPLLDALTLTGPGYNTAPFYLCTDQAGQQRRSLAEMLAAGTGTDEGKTYELAWCVAAVEAAGSDLDKAREWLGNWAPARGDSL